MLQTINDVIVGIIFFGTRLYMQEISKESTKSNSTALVLLNTRMLGDYKSIKEMMESPDANTSWGNQFAFLHIAIPKLNQLSNPLDFIYSAQKIIKRKRNSLAVYFTGKLLDIVTKFKGHEVSKLLMLLLYIHVAQLVCNYIFKASDIAINAKMTLLFSNFGISNTI